MLYGQVDVRVQISDAAINGLITSEPVQAGMDDLADAALRMQKALCPVDTGNLERHLQVKVLDGVGRAIGVFERIPLRPADYARYVEEGHRTRGGTWVPAQPFIRPSMDAVRARLKGN